MVVASMAAIFLSLSFVFSVFLVVSSDLDGFVVSCVFVGCRSGVVGGVGCTSLLTPTLASGVIAVVATLAVGVGGSLDVTFVANLNFVCRAPFSSVSFAGVTLVCLLFAPRLGDDSLPLAPEGLRRFEVLTMVGCSRSFGTLGNVASRAVPGEIA